MKIKIISDSTCDLSAELLAINDIALTPLTVVKNGEQFKDGVTITPEDIFAHVAAGGDLCSTSANSIGEYAENYRKYASEYDGVIQITIGSGFFHLLPECLSGRGRVSQRPGHRLSEPVHGSGSCGTEGLRAGKNRRRS